MLDELEVREIICGISTPDKIQEFHEWITKMHLSNQDSFNMNVVSMDVEDVKASYYDVISMSGKLVISKERQLFQKRLDSRLVHGIARTDGDRIRGRSCLEMDSNGER